MNIRFLLAFGQQAGLSVCLIIISLFDGCTSRSYLDNQSRIWQVSIDNISQFQVQADRQQCIVAVALELTYTGPPGAVPAPQITLSDERGKVFAPIDITRSVFNQAGDVNPSNLNEAFEVLNWFQQKSGEKTRRLSGGERFSLIYNFEGLEHQRGMTIKVNDLSTN